MLATQTPFPQYFDVDGSPLDDGEIFFGIANLNPETNPVAIFWDVAGTQPAAQPIRVLNGCAARSGTPAIIYTAGDYSITVRNKRGVIVYYCASSALFSNDQAILAQATASSDALRVSLAVSNDPVKGLGQVGWDTATAYTAGPGKKLREICSVRDWGAVGDGVADDTAAFNQATQATVVWSAALQYDIFIPGANGRNPMRYKINGTVYERKGQTLRGSGHGTLLDFSANTTTNSIVMGKGFIAGVATDDAGGAPVKVENFSTNGGAAAKGAIYTNAQGFEISSVFMTFPGIGLEIGVGASDGLVSNLQIDQAFNGITITNSQNLCFVNTNIYLAATGISIGASCADIQFNGGVIEYSTVAGVLFANGVSNIKGVLFTGVNFTMNAQNAGTFQGFIQSRAVAVEAQWTGCSFRNMYKWAINHQTNGYVEFTFTGCIFDGTVTNAAYTQSTTAMVLNTGTSGNYQFNGCEFRNLNAEIATINDNLSKLVIHGGLVLGCDGTVASQKRFNIVTVQPLVNISVKGVHGFGYVFTSGANQCCVLPWWAASTVWKVAIKGNTQSVGDSFYSAAEESVFAVTWQNNAGTKSIFADRINLWQTANRTNPGQLTSVVCLGTAPGGATSTTVFAATGTICISVPFASASNFDFYAETAT